jgi:Domain of unknown function (DU1801)
VTFGGSGRGRAATGAPAKLGRADTTKAVDQLMETLDHPFKAEIQILRGVVLGIGGGVAEGVKWKAPSFRTTEYFATTHLRGKGTFGLILHLGAKVRDLPEGGVKIEDGAGLLQWLAKDRAMIELASREELLEKRAALEAVLRQWIHYV